MPSSATPAAPVAPARAGHPGRMSRGAALWLNGAIMIAFFAASTAPSPLYALYREQWGFSALTLTLVFASYAFALLAALLVFGALSDHRGRRAVVIGALLLEIGAIVLFWQASSVQWLFAARILQGVASGIATSALSAGLLDLNRDRGALLNSISPMAGMAIGALGAGVLAEFAPAPTRLVYELLLAVLVAQTVAAFWLPETVSRRAGALASMKPQMAVPARARATLAALLPINTAQWALGGFYSSLGPSLARIVTGRHSPTIGGAAVAALVLSGAVAIVFVRERAPRIALVGGAWGLIAGVGITLLGLQMHSTSTFFAGTVAAGLGFGAAFNGSVRSLVPLAEAHQRAALMSTFYVLSYLAFSIPAILAGMAAGRFGLQPASLGYGLLLIVMAGVALVLMRNAAQPSIQAR